MLWSRKKAIEIAFFDTNKGCALLRGVISLLELDHVTCIVANEFASTV
jgi:hypothetical protein